MGLKKTAEQCRLCPRVYTCDHKRLEGYGFLIVSDIKPPVFDITPNVTVDTSCQHQLSKEKIIKTVMNSYTQKRKYG